MMEPDKAVDLSVTINGEMLDLRVQASETLLSTLRDRLALTGAKRGCNQGVCGACTVLIDGMAMRSCLAFAANCDGRSINTVEGLAPPGQMTALQRAFVEEGAVQCGFCTPGFLIALTQLFRDEPKPSVDQIRHAIAGNICRCSGYAKIVAAARRVAEAS